MQSSLLSLAFQILSDNCDDENFVCSYPSDISAHEFLALHSKINHNDYCLSYIFTNQDFRDGSLGLAYTANALRGKTVLTSL